MKGYKIDRDKLKGQYAYTVVTQTILNFDYLANTLGELIKLWSVYQYVIILYTAVLRMYAWVSVLWHGEVWRMEGKLSVCLLTDARTREGRVSAYSGLSNKLVRLRVHLPVL